MFSTILKEVTGYFDKRALISAFFPGMIFWGLTISIVLLQQRGWVTALENWKDTPATGQLMLLLAFFVWVAFWAFLTLNFHSACWRIYEGYWPFEFLVNFRRRHWQKCWDEQTRLDRQLERQESSLEGEREEFRKLQESLDLVPIEDAPTNIADIAGGLDLDLSALKQRVDRLEEELSESQTGVWAFWSRKPRTRSSREDNTAQDIYEQLEEIGRETRASWGTYLKYRNLDSSEQGPWRRRRNKLEELSGALEKIIENLWGEVEERRLRLNHEFFLLFSPHREEVMPTRLGNVLKAAEARVRLRYNLDALLAWSRLQPLLPKESAESLQAAKTSLDLMLTLSLSVLLFGFPLAVWLALQTSVWFRWWVPLIVLVVALVARLYVASIPAAIALIVALWLQLPNRPAWQAFLTDAEVVLTAVGALVVISWVCYQNAVQSCFAYGEKIQSAFDLYRWKLLEELHLQLPPTLEEERKLWKQLDELLYRGYEPSPDYYRYVKDEKKTKAPAPTAPGTTRLPVPARTLPAYAPIKEQDIVEVDLPDTDVPADAVQNRDGLIDMRALIVLPALKPVSQAVITRKELLDQSVAVGIQVNPADILGGRLAPGDFVDVIITATAALAKYENILVLDVVAPDVTSGQVAVHSSRPVVVLALARDQQEDFMVKKRRGVLNLTRRI